jgi:hypothetical protein
VLRHSCILRDVSFAEVNLKEEKKVYYESIKREPKIRGIKKCRCDERLQTKNKGIYKEVYYESIKREPKIKEV